MPCRRKAWILLVCGTLCGCVSSGFVAPDASYREERGRSRVVVLASARSEDGARATRHLASLVTAELMLRWFNLTDHERLVRESPDLAVGLSQSADLLHAGRPAPPDIVERLARVYGIGQVLLVDVFRHEEYWGRETRTIHIGVGARLVRLVDGHTLWEGRCAPQVPRRGGNGYEMAAHQAAQEIVQLLSSTWSIPGERSLASWPILEDILPE